MIALLLAVGLGATPTNAQHCKVLEGSERAVQALQRSSKKDAVYRFAVKQLGAPVSCEGRVTGTGDAQHSEITFHFSDGSTYSTNTSPPENGGWRLLSATPLRDMPTIRKLLHESGAPDVDSKTKPVEHLDELPGLRVETYWGPADGDNLATDLIYRSKELVGFGYHYAL